MPYMTVEKDPLDTISRFIEDCTDLETLSVFDGMLGDILQIHDHQKQVEKLDDNLYSGDRAQYAFYVMNLDMDRARFAAEKVSSKISYMNEMKLRELELKHHQEDEVSSDEPDPLTDEEKKEDYQTLELPQTSDSILHLAQQISSMPEFEWQDGMEAVVGDKKLRISGGSKPPADAYVSIGDPATKGILLDFARKLLKRNSLFISPPGVFSVGWGYGYAEPNLSYPKNSFKSSEEEVLALLILNYKNFSH